MATTRIAYRTTRLANKNGVGGYACLLGSVMSAAATAAPPPAGSLPVPCIAGSCGPGAPQTWVTSGQATATQVGARLTVDQTSNNAILNWQSFNIGRDATVRFVQPGANSLALNKIFQADPSQ